MLKFSLFEKRESNYIEFCIDFYYIRVNDILLKNRILLKKMQVQLKFKRNFIRSNPNEK